MLKPIHIGTKEKKAVVSKTKKPAKVSPEKLAKMKREENIQTYLAEILRTGHARKEGDSSYRYYKSGCFNMYTLECGKMIEIPKSTIKTTFPFTIWGYGADDAANARAACDDMNNNFDTFKNANFEESSNTRTLKKLKEGERVFVNIRYCNNSGNIGNLVYCDHWTKEAPKHNGEECREITSKEREELIKFYEEELAEFNKRLDTYLKKYGLSKIHAYTYYAD